MNTRALATKLIYEVLHNRRSLNEVLPIFKKQCKTNQDSALLQALAFGVIRWFPRLQYITNQLLQKPLKSKDIELLYLISVGLFQLSDMQVAKHAAVSETVEAAKQINKGWGAGLVNAVLRSYQRQLQTLQESPPNSLEAKYAHPQWLIDRIKNAWPTYWETILNANNDFPPLCLRVNIQKITRDKYIEKLKSVDLEAEPIPLTEAGIFLKTATEITMLPGFSDGLFSVQDAAAQYAASLLQLRPKLHVLDACAAPGGKTAHILETEPDCEVLALDISHIRTELIKDNLKRLQLNANVMSADASKPSTWWDKKPFDRILLDAPCSATGVIRRHPDIKYLRKSEDINQVLRQQLKLLEALWPLLKSDGILVYATCSILPEENSKLMEKFLSYQADAQILPFSLSYGIEQTIGYQILPGQNNMDGFYYATIKKIKR